MTPEDATVPRLSLSAGFSWDDSFTLPETSGGAQQSDSDDEMVEDVKEVLVLVDSFIFTSVLKAG